jgi:hypothetical protein
MASPQAPTNRPAWMIVLALAMALFGSVTVVEGLMTIRDPKAMARMTLRDVAMTPSQEEVARKLATVADAIMARHRTAVRLHGGFSIVFGLWTLYATAAVLSRDRNGRMLALATAVLGTAHRLAVLPFVIGVAGEVADATGPLLTELAGGAGSAGASLAEAAQRMVIRSLVISAAVGIGWWVLVFSYFGGRRGRELYGLPPR